jgi:hypothetical protein
MPARINPHNPYTVTCHASKPLCQTDAHWDEMPDDTQGIVSHYVDIERQRRRLLRFSFRAAAVAAPHSLQFLRALFQLRTALQQALPPVLPGLAAGVQRPRATHEQVARVEEQARLLFDTVFQLDAADDVNVHRFQWARVHLRLVQLHFVPGEGHASWLRRHDHGYIAYFRAAREGPAEEPAEGRRTRHQLRVLLPMYAPPPGLENFTHLFDIAGGPAVHLAYMGFLLFRTFDDARGSLRLRREQAAAALPAAAAPPAPAPAAP